MPVQGRQIKCAFAVTGANSWHVAALVTKGAYFEGDGGLGYRPAVLVDPGYGQIHPTTPEYGDVEPPDLSLPMVARYDDHGYILEACVLGSPAAVTIAASATGQVTSWSHVIDMADTIDGRHVTIAWDKSQFVQELTSGKVYGASEAIEGGFVKTTFSVVGSKATILSATNTSSTVYGATYPAVANRMQRKQAVARLNLQSAGSLVSTDAVEFDSLSLSYARAQARDHVGGQDYIIAPGDDGWVVPEIRLTFPRMNTVNAQSLVGAMVGGQAYKGDLTFTGAYINSTTTYRKLYQWPYLVAEEHALTPSGPGHVRPSVTFRAYAPASAPTGMTGVTRPMRLTRVMVNSLIAF